MISDFTHMELGSMDFFSKFSESQLRIIMQSCNIKNIRKDKAVFCQDDKAEAAFFILSGEVKKIKYRSDMTSIMIGRMNDNSWIGLPEMISSGPYLYDAITTKETLILVLPKTNLNRLAKITEFQNGIIKELSQGYYSIHAHLDVYTSLQKLIRFLVLQLNSFKDDSSEINVTQEYIAESIGVTRETVNKNLQLLQNKRLIHLSRSKIIFADKEKFLGFAKECL